MSATLLAAPHETREPAAGHSEPMAGTTVLLTAERRADQLSSLLCRRGAGTLLAPVLTLIPCSSDPDLIRATQDLLEDPPDVLVVTTAVGFRGWIEAADYVGLVPSLLSMLASVRILTRGPKALGAVLSSGLTPDWSAPSETSEEVVDQMLAEGVSGLRVAIQHHAAGPDGLDAALVRGGAEVVGLVTYRRGPAQDPEAVTASAQHVAGGFVDAVCFTSAMAVHAWFEVVEALGLSEQVTARVTSGQTVMAAVGPVCAAPLLERGITPLVPERSRLGALARTVVEHYASLPPIPTRAGDLRVRRTTAVLGDRVTPLSPTSLDLLRLLAQRPGAVVPRSAIQSSLPGRDSGGHAVDVAVSRLRDGLGSPGLVQTVVKRGYRLNVG